jgi:hypothetical protein
VYTEFPKKARGFIDLYRAFMVAFDSSLLLDAFYEFSTNKDGDRFYETMLSQEPDLATALRLLAMGDHLKGQVAQRWLRGDALATGDLRAVGISQKITSSEQATRILALIIKLLSEAATVQNYHAGRLIWLIDEFQRAQTAGAATLQDTNAGLHSLFNAAPTGFTPIISFKGSPTSQALPDWFSPDLRDRIGATKVLVLPPLQSSESMRFVKDILAHYRLHDGVSRADLFPFTPESCQRIIDWVASKGELRPRKIIHAFNAVLEAADQPIMKGTVQAIDPIFASKVLAEYVDVSTPAEDE